MLQCLITATLIVLALADSPVFHDFETYQSLATPYQTYRTANITSPIFNYDTWRKNLMRSRPSDHLFFTLDYSHAAGPYIFRDDDLSLVYANPHFDYAMNARVQTFNGRPWLTFWHGASNRGDSQGFCAFYNQQYQLVYEVTTRPPLAVNADMHECEVTFDDHVILAAYQDKVFDLTSIGGSKKDVLADSCFQEVGIREEKVYFTWCASDWFSPDLTYWNYTSTFDSRTRRSNDRDAAGRLTTSTGVDAYHINSVQKTLDGTYLVSLRDLKALVYIDGTTGEPVWNLNGKLNDFTDVTGSKVLGANKNSNGALSFGWQHHARFWGEGLTDITIFDNHELATEQDCTDSSCSRGRHIRIDTSNPDNLTVELVQDFWSPHGLKSVIFGSMHPLPYPEADFTSQLDQWLISWGINAEFSEHTSNGKLIRNVQYSPLYPGHSIGHPGGQSARIYKQSWHGYPTWPPSVVADRNGKIWVSWNGATEVREWAVYGSEVGDDLGDAKGTPRDHRHPVGTLFPLEPIFGVPRSGFETEIDMGDHHPAYVKVAALDVHGTAIGFSDTIWMGSENSFRYKETISYISLVEHLV